MALLPPLKSMFSLAQAKRATETQKRDGQYEGRELSEVDNLFWRTTDWWGGGGGRCETFFTHVSNNSRLNHPNPK